jgi:hypothetical protein
MIRGLILALFLLSSCANVSVRNYDPAKLKEDERTIVGSFEVVNEALDGGKPMSDCKLTFLMPDGETTRRYFSQKEDKGIVVTWANAGEVRIQGIDCGDGSFGLNLVDENYGFTVDPKVKTTYFGHLEVKGRFTGLTDAGMAPMGLVGLAIASGSRVNELKGIRVEDRWKSTQPVLAELQPSLAKEPAKKALIAKVAPRPSPKPSPSAKPSPTPKPSKAPVK